MEIFNILFLVFVLSTFVKQTNDDAFSLRSMNVMKGIAIVGVFVGHTSKEFLGFALYKLFCYIGLFSVSIFFFVSGYGLMYGMLNKKAYHKGFLKKRILPIGICYILTCNGQQMGSQGCFLAKSYLLEVL